VLKYCSERCCGGGESNVNQGWGVEMVTVLATGGVEVVKALAVEVLWW
jgi:hypothetical protein